MLHFASELSPLPAISPTDIAKFQTLYPIFQGDGVLAVASLGLAFMVAAYAIVLREIGKLLSKGIIILMTPTLSLRRFRKFIPAGALFNIAATLRGGTYQAEDLQSQLDPLFATYSVTQPEELKGALRSQSDLQRDASTYLGNATVFVAAWISTPWLLPECNPLVLAVKDVFWSGLCVLVIYLAIARARLLFDLQLSIPLFAQATAALVQKDPLYQDCLIAARSNPKPYRELVDLYLTEAKDDQTPSLFAYFRALVARQGNGPTQKLTVERYYPGPILQAVEDIRRFEWDKNVNLDYKNPFWLLKYVAWRVVLIGTQLKFILASLGLWRL